MTDCIRVAVIDHQPIYRNGVEQLLASAPNCSLVAQGEDSGHAIDIAMRMTPDLLLIDLNIPGNGLMALTKIAKQTSSIKIIVLTEKECEIQFLASFKAGARGYVAKIVHGNKLLQIMNCIHAGGSYAEPSLAGSCITHQYVEKELKKSQDLNLLTPREQDILELVAEAKTNKEIALCYDITERTVKYYMTNILQKLNVRNRVEAALVAEKYRQHSL